ncbi:MAG: nucleoside triphosphate pyrophosphohydrolase [Rikenellaceae bacterium]
MDKNREAIARLITMMNELREQCPWDREQTFETLRNATIEECYELVDAINKGEMAAIKEELGDLLLHVVFYSRLGEEQQAFDFAQVANELCDKLRYRHPHIYGDVDATTTDEVKRNWEALKLRKKARKSGTLGGVPVGLPAMVKALRIGSKAAGAGFDWASREDVWAKVQEEVDEVSAEMRSGNHQATEEEFGDLFFALINAARLYEVDPEAALEHTNRKFITRFGYMEQAAEQAGQTLAELPLEQQEALWCEAKQKGL